jgi:hypothetical protein
MPLALAHWLQERVVEEEEESDHLIVGTDDLTRMASLVPLSGSPAPLLYTWGISPSTGLV